MDKKIVGLVSCLCAAMAAAFLFFATNYKLSGSSGYAAFFIMFGLTVGPYALTLLLLCTREKQVAFGFAFGSGLAFALSGAFISFMLTVLSIGFADPGKAPSLSCMYVFTAFSAVIALLGIRLKNEMEISYKFFRGFIMAVSLIVGLAIALSRTQE